MSEMCARIPPVHRATAFFAPHAAVHSDFVPAGGVTYVPCGAYSIFGFLQPPSGIEIAFGTSYAAEMTVAEARVKLQ